MMKHTTSRILFAYWDRIRGSRSAPDRALVQPGEIRHVLADTFMLGLDGPAGPTFRLAGTRLAALFARNLAETPFERLWALDDREEARGTLKVIGSETLGALLGVTGRNENGSELPMEMLLLPLRHRGRMDARLLGALSAASIPSWAGLVPLATLHLTSRRMIEPARRELEDLRHPSGRPLLVVHDGGLA